MIYVVFPSIEIDFIGCVDETEGVAFVSKSAAEEYAKIAPGLPKFQRTNIHGRPYREHDEFVVIDIEIRE